MTENKLSDSQLLMLQVNFMYLNNKARNKLLSLDLDKLINIQTMLIDEEDRLQSLLLKHELITINKECKTCKDCWKSTDKLNKLVNNYKDT